MATGIKDKVAIIGMGCSRFGERWDVGTDGLLAEAFDDSCDAELRTARRPYGADRRRREQPDHRFSDVGQIRRDAVSWPDSESREVARQCPDLAGEFDG